MTIHKSVVIGNSAAQVFTAVWEKKSASNETESKQTKLIRGKNYLFFMLCK